VWVDFNFTSVIGREDYYFFADSGDVIIEEVENDNQNSSEFNVPAWHTFFGSVLSIRWLAGDSGDNFTEWGIDPIARGNIFVADLEANIDWASLLPLGKTKIGGNVGDDFPEVDSALGMEGFQTLFQIFTLLQLYRSYSFNSRVVENVPSSVSRSGVPFYTGVLWDSSDSANDEYDLVEREDLVFVTEIAAGSVCEDVSCDL
jgi:hypothetical protein